MLNARTSDRVSSIAARFAKLTPETLLALTAKPDTCEHTAADIRTMAASLLRQDEVKGLRKLFKKVIG